MTIVSNTFTTYSAKGIREDLSNVITNIAPEETPFQSIFILTMDWIWIGYGLDMDWIWMPDY